MARCEASVFFLMGRIYKKLNQPARAQRKEPRGWSALLAVLSPRRLCVCGVRVDVRDASACDLFSPL